MRGCHSLPLLQCERQGHVWGGTLFAAAPTDGFVFPGKCASGCAAGEWYAPCLEAHSEAAKCTSLPRELVILTHLPKAGGSSLGEALMRAHTGANRLGACRLLWNGRSRRTVCRGIREWIGRRGVSRAPPLPFGSLRSAAPIANASLETALAFRRCSFLWTQHMDFSIVELIQQLHPGILVRPIIVLRNPVLE